MTRPLAMIPDDWATKGHCPVCGGSPLTVQPQLEVDRLACPRCCVAFEVEDGGPRLRLVRLPAAVGASPDGTWRTAVEARAWVRQLAGQRLASRPSRPAPLPPAPSRPEAPKDQAAAPAPSEPLVETSSSPLSDQPVSNLQLPHTSQSPVSSSTEALSRAKELLNLKHTLPQIQAILERSGQWTPEQVQAVMAELASLAAAAKARQNRTLRLMIGGSLSLLLVVAVAAVSTTMGRPRVAPEPARSTAALQPGTPAAPPVATPTPASWMEALLRPLLSAQASPAAASQAAPAADTGDLPAPLLTLVPPGARLVNPTPVVRPVDGGDQALSGEGAASASLCPGTPEDAARLFGGEADAWQPGGDAGGWIMVSVTELATVRVPAGMTAAYLTIGETLSMNEVPGPAVIEGIAMVAISCE